MTNKDKFLRDGVSVEEVKTDFCRYLSINGYDTSTVGNVCFALEHFLEEPTKPTLTEDERVILRNIMFFTKIGKDRTSIYVATKENSIYRLGVFNHLFQFIKERRRILNRRTIKRRINE